MVTAAELPIDTTATDMEMAEAMFGSGITITSASYTGADEASGIYSNGDSVADAITPSDSGVILSTGKATDLTRDSGDANRQADESTNWNLAGDQDLEAIAGAKTYDAAIFEATFIPDGSILTMQVTFSSEEYLEYVNSGFNDAVGIWVNGEKAELTVGDGDITINNINGQEVVAGQTITLPTGEMITLNADGTITAESDGDFGENVFSYTIEDSDGNTDVGFVTLTTAPCFVAGTRIITNRGEAPVETLEEGDMVLTRDNGFQPLRWIGKTTRVAEGIDAPIRFEAGALGAHEAVEFSPNHRVLLSSARASLLFGEPEVLVKAKDLVNDTTIRPRADGSPVTYVHLLFDRHEIVRGNGLDSESYHPGHETVDSFDAETREEILRLMPNADARMGYGYGPAARISLRAYEAKALLRDLQTV